MLLARDVVHIIDKLEIQERLGACKACGLSDYSPFVFPLKDQKVMIISAMPSVQAMYKPLTSIRFFRRLCVALLGDGYLRRGTQCEKYLLEFCDGGLYWTHYRKCFDPRLKDISKVDDACARTYLADEVEALRPKLKLIVVLGDAIAERVRAITGRCGIETLYMPFPTADNADKFADIRQKIVPHLKHMRSIGMLDLPDRLPDESGESSGLGTHLSFAIKALERALRWKRMNVSSVEDLWYKNLVVPNMRRCSKLVSACSYSENQIKVALHEHCLETGRPTRRIEREWRQLRLHQTPGKRLFCGRRMQVGGTETPSFPRPTGFRLTGTTGNPTFSH